MSKVFVHWLHYQPNILEAEYPEGWFLTFLVQILIMA